MHYVLCTMYEQYVRAVLLENEEMLNLSYDISKVV